MCIGDEGRCNGAALHGAGSSSGVDDVWDTPVLRSATRRARQHVALRSAAFWLVPRSRKGDRLGPLVR